MTDFTSRMASLLGAMRRERNGAVADAMRFYGRPYGLNYGVSLPTLRKLARAEGHDHAYARYLYLQEVRELRLAAFHIAEPACVTPEEFPFWAEGLLNSEMAEEGAFALLSHIDCFAALFDAWTSPEADPLLRYAALMGACRTSRASAEWADRAVDVVSQAAAAESPAAMLLARGATAMLSSLAARDVATHHAVVQALESLGTRPAEAYVRDELAWQLEA